MIRRRYWGWVFSSFFPSRAWSSKGKPGGGERPYGSVETAGCTLWVVILVADLAVEDAGAAGAEKAWWRMMSKPSRLA